MMGRIPSDQEIDRVRWYIEMCLKGYMTKWEIIECLARRANIEPAFTLIVLERLEEENEEFFRGYNLRMALRHHIMHFPMLPPSRQHPPLPPSSHQHPPMHQRNGNASHQRPPLPPPSHQRPPLPPFSHQRPPLPPPAHQRPPLPPFSHQRPPLPPPSHQRPPLPPFSHQRPPLLPTSHQHPPIMRPHNALQVSNPNAAESGREAMQEQVLDGPSSSDDESID